MDVSAFFKIINNKKGLTFISPFLEATTRFELVIRVLQTHALPLGYVALQFLYYIKQLYICQEKIKTI